MHLGCGTRTDPGAGITPTDPDLYRALRVPEWDLNPGDKVEVLPGRIEYSRHSGESDEWVPAVVGKDGATLSVQARAVRRGPGQPDLFRVAPDCPLPEGLRPNVLMCAQGLRGGVETRGQSGSSFWMLSTGAFSSVQSEVQQTSSRSRRRTCRSCR